jgi:DDE superfamily endonuclease
MEMILRLYLLPYNIKRPVICFDERPCFLIGDTVQGIQMQSGSPAKENYAYSKHGSCCILAAIEPKTGKRLAHVRKQRRCQEFAIFMKNLAANYEEAEKIIVVLDNLNTHNFSAFYQFFPAEEAAKLADRFEFVYTPKSASWLNMIEIEFSALSRQCLNRRIPSINKLAEQVMAYFKERMELNIDIKWQFSRENARKTLNRHYVKVNPENSIYK